VQRIPPAEPANQPMRYMHAAFRLVTRSVDAAKGRKYVMQAHWQGTLVDQPTDSRQGNDGKTHGTPSLIVVIVSLGIPSGPAWVERTIVLLWALNKLRLHERVAHHTNPHL